ncbi:MAG: hypothetical protein RLZZ436_4494 [Planctomycetota bacterium]
MIGGGCRVYGAVRRRGAFRGSEAGVGNSVFSGVLVGLQSACGNGNGELICLWRQRAEGVGVVGAGGIAGTIEIDEKWGVVGGYFYGEKASAGPCLLSAGLIPKNDQCGAWLVGYGLELESLAVVLELDDAGEFLPDAVSADIFQFQRCFGRGGNEAAAKSPCGVRGEPAFAWKALNSRAAAVTGAYRESAAAAKQLEGAGADRKAVGGVGFSSCIFEAECTGC